MFSPTKCTTAAALLAALALAACGGDDRLTRDEYAAELQPAVDEISQAFGAVFASIGKAEESDRVPAAALERLSDAAARERAAAAELAKLEPPKNLEGPAERFVAGARRQADELEGMAGEKELTVARLADAVEQGASVGPLRELGEAGVVKPPGADH